METPITEECNSLTSAIDVACPKGNYSKGEENNDKIGFLNENTTLF